MSTLIIYATIEEATAQANYVTQQTGRYWTAYRTVFGQWMITDRYHPKTGGSHA
jgi:hypothetical protein